ncbi:MAG: PilN domain-containing protein [Candidatus Omnitrophica bacterium]|nr:PilN domain-containing protein [Candidatus Omnitrophota bacterium]
MGTFKLPSQKQSELLSMTEFQFARMTPQRRGDMVVGVKYLEKASATQSLVSGVMAVKENLKTYWNILDQGGISPDVMTVNTQRLLPLARNIWGVGLNGEGRVLGLALDGVFWLGFFARGEMLFSREDRQINDRDSALGAFIEYCHEEFPGTPVKEGILLGSQVDVGTTRTVAGVPFGVQELSTVARTVADQAAFEVSPVAYLDLLLARDNKGTWFDFLSEEMKAKRDRAQTLVLVRHGVIIGLMFLTGLFLLVGSQVYKEKAEIQSLARMVDWDAGKVKTLEEKSLKLSAVERHFSDNASASVVFAEVSRLLSKEARLNQIDLKDGLVNLQGEAASLDAVRAFQTALTGTALFRDVHLEGIDKRPTDSAQIVMFRMTMKVGK